MRKLIAILLGLFMSRQSWAAISHVGSTQNTASSNVASVTRAAGSTSNLYTVYCGGNVLAGTQAASNTTTAFTWTSAFGIIHNGASNMQMFWAVPSTTASQTITCTGSSGTFEEILLDEWSGTNTSTPIDVSSGTFNTVSACNTVGTMSVNNDAMLCGAVDSITAVGNINASLATQGANDGFGDWTEWRINSGTGSGSTVAAAWTGTAAGALCVTAGILPAAAAATNTCAEPYCGVIGQ